MENVNVLTRDDINNLIDYYEKNKDYINIYDGVPDITDRAFFDKLFENIVKKKCFCYCLKNNNKIIGVYFLEEINKFHYDSALLSYNIDKDYSNKGITTNILQKNIPRFLEVAKVSKLKCIIEKNNFPSVSVLKKLNFSFYGPIDHFFKINGKMKDCYLAYSNLN